jgi:very-short-patch-repair endonuclease
MAVARKVVGLPVKALFLPSKAMNPTANARRLRRDQTDEEKELWRALRAGRFAGFKFRRQHPAGEYWLDFYCPVARLSVELDGFQHGLPEQMQRDEKRRQFLVSQDIEELRFWNRQWRTNREGVLLDIWEAIHRRTGRVKIMRKVQNHRFVPPDPAKMVPRRSKS